MLEVARKQQLRHQSAHLRRSVIYASPSALVNFNCCTRISSISCARSWLRARASAGPSTADDALRPLGDFFLSMRISIGFS